MHLIRVRPIHGKGSERVSEAQNGLETATFGGGCFWCLEAVFQQLDGVESVAPGYAGGKRPNPSYAQVCTGATGHAEVVQLRFDPGRISFEALLDVFFAAHDPTQLNRQGNDIGTQYRSVIFWHSEQQRDIARSIIAALDAADQPRDPVVTELSPLPTFYPAEPYHHDYYNNNAMQPYCQLVVEPKIMATRRRFPDRVRQS